MHDFEKVDVGYISKLFQQTDGMTFLEVTFHHWSLPFHSETTTIINNNNNLKIKDIVRLTIEDTSENKINVEKVLDLKTITYDDYSGIQKMGAQLNEEELQMYHRFLTGKMYDKNKEYSDMFLGDLARDNCCKQNEQINKFLNSKYVSQYLLKKIINALENSFNAYRKDFYILLEYMKNSGFAHYRKKHFEVSKILQGRDIQNITKREMDEIDKILKEEVKVIGFSRLDKQNDAISSAFHFDELVLFMKNYIELKNTLNSSKEIYNLSCKDIKLIMDSLHLGWLNLGLFEGKPYFDLIEIFFPVLFNINSKGAREYLNNYNNQKVARHLLHASLGGVGCYPERMVDETGIIDLFQKLNTLDYKKALAIYHFIERVDSFKKGYFFDEFEKLASVNYDVETWSKKKFLRKYFGYYDSNDSYGNFCSFCDKISRTIGEIRWQLSCIDIVDIEWTIRSKKRDALEKKKNELLRQKILGLLKQKLGIDSFNEKVETRGINLKK